jgi:uncharacterized phage protein (TIGR01671 family)
MNDRFRFRAIDNRDWSDGKGEIYYDVQDSYDWSGGEPDVPATCFGSIVDGEGWIVEQCTGLKDKNGRLIYEGDIVKEKLFNTDIAVIKFGNGSGFQCFYPEWKGKYSKETKYNPGFRKDLYYWLKEKQEGMEVIGNIHENPELLEDK